jgi:hypothetical protein
MTKSLLNGIQKFSDLSIKEVKLKKETNKDRKERKVFKHKETQPQDKENKTNSVSEMSRISGLTQILTNFNMEQSPVITIQCDNGDIEVQKSLLTAVSDVFKAMLETDMLEKRTNLVLAHDLNFETMKSIMDYYKEGFKTGFWNKASFFETTNRDAFTYIVEKYNFLAIKEEIAQYLLQSYRVKQDLTILESVFFTYGNQIEKMFVIREMTLMIAEGKDVPQFVTNFNAHDFLELAKCCCAALKNSQFSRYQCFLKTLYSWLSKDSEKRSVAALEIVGMIDMTTFKVHEVESVLQSLTISPKFQGLKLLCLEFFLPLINRDYHP